VQRWALDYVRSTDLAHKFAPPPLPDLWEDAPPERRVAQPGRPPELEITDRSPKSPGPEALREPRRRVQIFHTFLHHELQAAELMAWALLAFPAAPRAFHRGLLGVLQDELRHMALYEGHMRSLGGQFGDLPVRDWFWARVPLAATPAHFAAVMGMGLEAANLDHAARFAARLLAVGDARGAEIEAQVGEEEVPHVRFAVRWFDRLAVPSDGPIAAESAFAAWARHLPPPLSPLLMRGDPLDRAQRERAGLSREFIEELASWRAA
jgi:uncharacterized ferritin-like protein (DUF455 family)